MTAFDYSGIQTTASTLLTSFGQAVTINRILSETYDAVTGTSSNVTTLNTAGVAVLTRIDRAYKEQASGTIEDGDLMAVFDSTIEPKVADTITIGSTNYNVISVQVVKPGDTAIVYKAQIRGTAAVSDTAVNVLDGGASGSVFSGSYDGGSA